MEIMPQEPGFKYEQKQARLIFLGETGSGKTTLIQSIKDFVYDVSYEKRELLELERTAYRSQTQEVEEKEPFINDEWNVTIVDTPGLADTEGKEKDKKHFDELAEFLAENTAFNAVCFVLNNTKCRLTQELQYVFEKLRILFPDYLENFFLILTHSEESSHSFETQAVIKGLFGYDLPKGKIFYINNQAYQTYIELTEEIKEDHEFEYDINKKNIRALLEAATVMKPYISEGRVWIEQRKFDLTCEIASAIFKRDALFHENAQIRLILDNLEQNKIDLSNCRLTRTKFQNSENGANPRSYVVCMICARFCREVYKFEQEKEIDFSNIIVQWYKDSQTKTEKAWKTIALIPLSILGLIDLIYRRKCRKCVCSSAYHAKFGMKIEHIEEDLKFDEGGHKIKLHQELQDIERNIRETQTLIQKNYNILSKLNAIGKRYIYISCLQLELKRIHEAPSWLKDYVTDPELQKRVMNIKEQFLKEIYHTEATTFTPQIQDTPFESPQG